MKPAVASSFDVADWFIRQSKRERVPLSPLKLHRLLYLAQAEFAVRNGGQALMPSVFVVSELGPLEPNLYRAFEYGTPRLTVRDPAERARLFLEGIWRAFGEETVEALNRHVARDPAYKEAEAEGAGTEISLALMQRHHRAVEEPKERVVAGKRVRAWVPPAKTPPAPAKG
jgi:uncharacterized phage-associated protein